MSHSRQFTQAALLGSLLALGSVVSAQTTSVPITPTAKMPGGMLANLDAATEVPPTNSEATATMETSFNKQTNELRWTINYRGLSGPLTAAHFHGPAMPGQNAGAVVPIAVGKSPITGMATLTAAQAADLSAGKWYVNLHTASHPGGEIRAQVAPQL